MSKDIKFNIKLTIDGKEQVVTASTNVKKLAKDLSIAQKKADSTMYSFLRWNQVSTVLNTMSSSMQTVNTLLTGLASATEEQVTTETKLSTVMRQRMGANDGMIQSVKDLCSEQQKLGIIGDEVQLAGAQQMATFLKEKQALDILIPAMNDLVAQQKGFSATGQDAVNVGNLIGKVMQGQTSALTRVGVTFDEAQEKVLKYGTELDRAAMLAEVITANVGHMNAELAKTDAGKQKQLENTIGDLKETFGKAAQQILPFTTIITQAVTGVNGFVALSGSLRAIYKALNVGTISYKAYTSAVMASNVVQAKAAVYTRIFGAAMNGTAYQAVALKLALKGLMVASGVGLAIAALTTVVELFSKRAKGASEDISNLNDSKEAMISKSASVTAELEEEKNKLKELIESHGDASGAIRTLNEKYGESFGYYQTAEAWYDALTEKSKTYALQLGYEAQARVLASQIAEKTLRKEADEAEMARLRNEGKHREKKYTVARAGQFGATSYMEMGGGLTDEYKALATGVNTADDEIEKLSASLDIATRKSKELKESLGSVSAVKNGAAVNAPVPNSHVVKGKVEVEVVPAEGSRDYLEKLISDTTRLRDASADENEQMRLQQMVEDYQRQLNAMDLRLGIKVEAKGAEEGVKEIARTFNPLAGTIKDIQNNIDILQDQLENATTDEAPRINQEIKAWKDKADAIRNAGLEAKSYNDIAAETWGNIKGLGSGLENIISAATESGNAWQYFSGIMDGALQIMSAVKGMSELLGVATKVNTVAKTAETAAIVAGTTATVAEQTAGESAAASTIPQIIANKALTKSYMELAAAEFVAAHAGIPFAGAGLAASFTSAANALVLAQKAIPFADGGIVSGPTVALAGEYPGASSNPEVIAPLDKLRGMLSETQGQLAGDVRFVIEARTLVGLLKKELNAQSRQ